MYFFRHGFSLVEILVSLFIVSITAVNISGLQKVVGQQTRDNFTHALVVQFVSEKFEELLQYDQLHNLLALSGTEESFQSEGTEFYFKWAIASLEGAPSSSPIRTASLTITWLDSYAMTQTYTRSKHISLALLSEEALGRPFEHTVPNLLETDKVDYFEAKMGYKIGAYVIYDSQLFQATEVHDVGNGAVRNLLPPISKDGVVAGGWDKLGRVDNKELARLFID
jgi:prepilin-type N-terminal cleavage/methylation domain-containing protein